MTYYKNTIKISSRSSHSRCRHRRNSRRRSSSSSRHRNSLSRRNSHSSRSSSVL